MSVNPRTKRLAAWTTAGVVGAVAVGAAALSQVGIAAADTASPSPSASAGTSGQPGAPDGHGMRGPGGRGGAEHAVEHAALAKVLGLTVAELDTQLKAGKSLAVIAKAKGIALQTVIDALVAQEKAELAAAVKAGRLTQAQADTMSNDVVARVTDRVNRVPGTGGPGGPGGCGPDGGDWGHGGPGGAPWGHGGPGGAPGMPGGPGGGLGGTAPSGSATAPPTSGTSA